MWLHISFFKKWQIDATGIDEKPHALLYTSYLLRVVSRDYEEGLAVLLPCFWVYMHVGKCMLNLSATMKRVTIRRRFRSFFLGYYKVSAADALKRYLTTATSYLVVPTLL